VFLPALEKLRIPMWALLQAIGCFYFPVKFRVRRCVIIDYYHYLQMPNEMPSHFAIRGF